ncbi:prolipoprotein diacylglyceryl transferase [Oceanispirochaeta crateris]|uniref:Phosphatidylglycerol--prolipoprotein diacylglyceryl transferase n=1 Tax=Oceanispirochaeta crateris TaxID=2518645 RepID=A0A5C1QLZ5_9SPIO|nr:prolipoprotein diacylglyceryl transferase [Oceanispirochaeta crateris]QEN09093.1 prolipoprotein diacylglyceryl transferase [Oceanispirochaeta crateris]
MLYIYFPEWLKPEIIPGLPVRWYGLMYILAFAVTYLLFKKQMKEESIDISDDDVSNLFFAGILGLILGARLMSALVYDTSGIYWSKPWLIFWPFMGGQFVGLQGMSYHGGLIGTLVAVVIYCRRHKIYFPALADRIVLGVPLGYTFGRLGNFINGELYGRVTTSSVGMVFPYAGRFSPAEEWVKETASKIGMDISGMSAVNLPRHPSQLYEAFGEGILLWIFLWFVIRKRKKFEGAVIGWYLIGYGSVRFVIEYFREPDAGLDFPLLWGNPSPNYIFASLFNFTTGQIFCFAMILSGLLCLLLFRWKDRRRKGPGLFV